MKRTNKDLRSQGEPKRTETAFLLMKHVCADSSRCDTVNPREVEFCNDVFLKKKKKKVTLKCTANQHFFDLVSSCFRGNKRFFLLVFNLAEFWYS